MVVWRVATVQTLSGQYMYKICKTDLRATSSEDHANRKISVLQASKVAVLLELAGLGPID
jgi:hypothetical protein